jgi:F-type H+-transporting ATPase subunit epsilon
VVGPGGLTVLADTAAPLDGYDTAMLATEIKDAEEDVADSTDPKERDKVARRLDQLKALQAALAAPGTAPR